MAGPATRAANLPRRSRTVNGLRRSRPVVRPKRIDSQARVDDF
jgi:hypothetical protein